MYTTSIGGEKPTIIPKQNTKYFNFKEVFEWKVIN